MQFSAKKHVSLLPLHPPHGISAAPLQY